MAKVAIAFDAWKEGKVAPTQHEILVVRPERLDLKVAAVSKTLIRELIHPNKPSGTSHLTGIQFSPDGKRIIAADQGIVALWEVETGKRLTAIDTGAGRGHFSFSVTADWKTLYASRPGKRKYERVAKDGKPIERLAFDGSVRRWDLPTGESQKTFQHDPPRYIFHMRLSPDGSQFTTTEEMPGTYENSTRRGVSLWDTRSAKYLNLSEDLQLSSIFSPDGKTLAGTRVEKNDFATAVVLLDTATGKVKGSIPVTEKNVTVDVEKFSPDGKLMLVHYRVFERINDAKNFQERFELVDTANCKKVASFVAEKNEMYHEARFSPDGQTLAFSNVWSKETKLLLFSIPENSVVKTITLGQATKGEWPSASGLVFHPDGKRLAIITQVLPEDKWRFIRLDALDVPQPRIHLIDLASGEIRETLVAPQGLSREACFSPDGRRLAVGGHGRILLWDVSAPTP